MATISTVATNGASTLLVVEKYYVSFFINHLYIHNIILRTNDEENSKF